MITDVPRSLSSIKRTRTPASIAAKGTNALWKSPMLRRLEGAERPRVEPTPRAVDRDAEVRHQDQEHQERDRHRASRCKRAQAAIVEAAQDE
jgi:hypothetical protein